MRSNLLIPNIPPNSRLSCRLLLLRTAYLYVVITAQSIDVDSVKRSRRQYIVSDPTTQDAALIDTVLDYELASGTVSTTTADEIITFIRKAGLNIKYILETHAHADHLIAAQYHKIFSRPVGIGKRISIVQQTFAPVYGFDPSSSFVNALDLLFDDDEEFKLGSFTCRVIHLPGHTPDHVGYVIGGSVFTGDSVFQPDVGSARSDFPGGDARMLYTSMQRLMALPESFRLFVGHDYPADREPMAVSTVGEQLQSNKHSRKGISESDFVAFRNSRDSVLGASHLLQRTSEEVDFLEMVVAVFPSGYNSRPL
ncbi:beta-lactamase-like protein [Mycena galericulata]|nr:beta-lactamase-like protein [Mycena galericulata]